MAEEAIRKALARGLSATMLEGGDIVSIAPDGIMIFASNRSPSIEPL